MNLKKININIWDDFYEDGHVPEGEKQETYIYVEEDLKDVSHDDQKRCLEILSDYIMMNLNTLGIKMWIEEYDSRKKYQEINEIDNPQFMKDHPNFHFKRWKIMLEDLTHERLDQWMRHLENVKLHMNGVPFNIYSES